jgi:cytochrome c oxidase assembly protein subunit 15
MVRSGAPAAVVRRGETLLVVLVAQGALGYLQYFTGVPAALVAIHIGLAASVWALAIRFHLSLFERPGEPVAAHPAAGGIPAKDAALAVG